MHASHGTYSPHGSACQPARMSRSVGGPRQNVTAAAERTVRFRRRPGVGRRMWNVITGRRTQPLRRRSPEFGLALHPSARDRPGPPAAVPRALPHGWWWFDRPRAPKCSKSARLRSTTCDSAAFHAISSSPVSPTPHPATTRHSERRGVSPTCSHRPTRSRTSSIAVAAKSERRVC